MNGLDLSAHARVLVPAGGAPARAVIDSRQASPGDLFVGLPGASADGGAFAADALTQGAWGVLVRPEHADGLGGGAVLVADDPLAALQGLATAWRRRLGAPVIGVTGSVGKTSTKDVLAAVLAPQRRVHASRENFNTEIGLPLEVLAAPEGTEVLVLEMAMRGPGQIAELAAIAEPDVGVITNVGPVHLEMLGSIEAIAAAKAEILADVSTAVVPFGEPLLMDLLPGPPARVVTFGPGGDVDFDGDVVVAHGERLDVSFGFTAAHQRRNALAAVAAALAVGVRPGGEVDVRFSALRGERIELPRGATVVNDCYNANPLSMRAALDDLSLQDPDGRRVAVLGDMLELGEGEADLHRALGAYARERGVDVLIAVGRLAGEVAEGFGGESHVVADAAQAARVADELVAAGDLVLVKGSRGVGLEVVAERLVAT